MLGESGDHQLGKGEMPIILHVNDLYDYSLLFSKAMRILSDDRVI
jgi:hypothetical protein